MKKYGTESMHGNNHRKSHSEVARNEARDDRGRFTTSGRNVKAEKTATREDDCACTQSIGTDYADQKYHHEHGHPWNNEKKHSGKHHQGHKGGDEPVEVISITSYTITEL